MTRKKINSVDMLSADNNPVLAAMQRHLEAQPFARPLEEPAFNPILVCTGGPLPCLRPVADHRGMHLSHCYLEEGDGCKYGDDNCPAKPAPDPEKARTDAEERKFQEQIIELLRTTIVSLRASLQSAQQESYTHKARADALALQVNAIRSPQAIAEVWDYR